ncbi:WD domain-containing protein [Pleurostoma richardsiae]|uniref:WD domain-containing protein n=1 Tax=Pleurostoma richardsiae TaxID=41990 RepID=A0AA38RRA2_9PEZI|nr:WD domain-containing protein [Pleurostoma richardsiae]
MAVTDDDTYHPTEALIRSQPRRHYRVPIHPLHWQLRSQLGVQKQDTLFYPTGGGNAFVHKLNVTTRESETFKVLSFSPRCLVAGYGWVCCGGETGEFAAIPTQDATDSSNDSGRSLPLGLDSDPDARSPLSLNSSSRDDSVLAIISYSRDRLDRSLLAKSKSFGKERVNCITLWSPPTRLAPHKHAYSQTVAVLANNDKHVIVVNLQDMEPLDEISYPDCVNRAVLSPDGRLLIAISDDPYLYIHERVEKSGANLFTDYDKSDREWKHCGKIHLKSQRKEDKSDTRGSFAACFSNTGRYLAVGTQYGVISIFDTSVLARPGVDPLITCFRSSRPNTEAGAIRDMAFAPGPFDLLAWTEDRGRIGVADVRTNYVARQILNLGEYDAYEHIIITERGTIDPQLLEGRGPSLEDLLSAATGSPGATEEARPSAAPRTLDSWQNGLSADETLVLDALQEHRRRRERREQADRAERTPVPAAVTQAELARRSITTDNTRTSRERSADVNRAVTDILGNIRDQRERLRDTQERLRAHTRSLEEADRRRLLAAAQPAARRANAPRDAQDDGAGGRPPIGLRLQRPGGLNGWSDLEALYNLSMENPTPSAAESRGVFPGATTGGGVRLDALLMRDTISPWDDGEAEMGRLNRRSRGHRPLGAYGVRASDNRPEPDETAGLAWSEDGQILFVGAENGIYEFHVNVVGRKMFPSMTMR